VATISRTAISHGPSGRRPGSRSVELSSRGVNMIHMTPEDLNSCGLAKDGDSLAQAFFRPFTAIVKAVASCLQDGPAEGIKTAVQESNRIHEQTLGFPSRQLQQFILPRMQVSGPCHGSVAR
jgi:hypothetical protein